MRYGRSPDFAVLVQWEHLQAGAWAPFRCFHLFLRTLILLAADYDIQGSYSSFMSPCYTQWLLRIGSKAWGLCLRRTHYSLPPIMLLWLPHVFFIHSEHSGPQLILYSSLLHCNVCKRFSEGFSCLCAFLFSGILSGEGTVFQTQLDQSSTSTVAGCLFSYLFKFEVGKMALLIYALWILNCVVWIMLVRMFCPAFGSFYYNCSMKLNDVKVSFVSGLSPFPLSLLGIVEEYLY